VRDERREAVAEIVHAALDFNMLVNTILAWHDAEVEGAVADRARLWKQLTDAEMRAAQDELAELTAEGERLVMALNAKGAETRALREALGRLLYVPGMLSDSRTWDSRQREVHDVARALLTSMPGAGKP